MVVVETIEGIYYIIFIRWFFPKNASVLIGKHWIEFKLSTIVSSISNQRPKYGAVSSYITSFLILRLQENDEIAFSHKN